MAIQRMRYVTLMGPVDRFDWIAEHCVVPYSFEPVKTAGSGHILLPFEDENPYQAVMKKIETAMKAANLCPEDVRTRQDAAFEIEDEEEIDSFLQIMEELSAKRKQLEAQVNEKEALLKQLMPLKEMGIPFEKLFSMKFIGVRFGRMPLSSYRKLETYGNEAKVFFMPITVEKTSVFGIAFMAVENRESAKALLDSLYFERVYIPEDVHDDPEVACRLLERQLRDLGEEVAVLDRQMAEQIQTYERILCELYGHYRYLSDRFDLRKYAHHSDTMCSISGWVLRSELPAIAKIADSDDDIMMVVQRSQENPNLKPPTQLKNLPIARFFQYFVEMYGLPSYHEADPTLFVAITYTLFFGIMFGDVGQGAVLFLVGLLMWFKMKMPLGRIISVIGVASSVAGFFLGSVFGNEEWIHGFTVLHGNHPLYLLLFAAAFGLVLIALAMILNIYNGLRAKDIGKWLFSPNGLLGMVLFFGNVAAGLLLLLKGINLWSPLYLTVTTFVPLLCLFLAGPLTRLLQGKKDWLPKNFGEFFAESFFELFEVLLSYMSNAISYVRIGAFAISHAGMMLVVTNMAEMAGEGVGKILVLILGNIFVIGLEGLIVGIQCLRLQFYEFFSRFYSGGGRAFKPVNLKR